MSTQDGRLPAPLLYLSAYLERDRPRYYEALQVVREAGDVEPWLGLFLEAVESQAADAVVRAGRILELRERYRREASVTGSANTLALVDLICESPIVRAGAVMTRVGVTRPTALRLLRQIESAGILERLPVGKRGEHRFVARALLDAIAAD